MKSYQANLANQVAIPRMPNGLHPFDHGIGNPDPSWFVEQDKANLKIAIRHAAQMRVIDGLKKTCGIN